VDKILNDYRGHGGALLSLSACMLLSALGMSVANVALPSMATTFDAPFRAVQWVVLAYLLAVTTLVLAVGRLGDVAGRKRLLLAGIAIFTAASAACAVSPSLPLLIAARALQGGGAAIMMALATGLVADAVPKVKTGIAMGLLGTMSALGTALGPTLGGLVIAGIGWQWIFAINVPVGLLAFALARRYLPADRARIAGAGRFDVPGTLVLAMTLGAYALGTTAGGAGVRVLLLVGAGIGGLAFYLVQKRTKNPLAPWRLVRERSLTSNLLGNTIVSTVMMATLIVGPFYLSTALGLSAPLVGMAMSVGPAVVALAGVPAGLLVDRMGTQRVLRAGLATMTAGCLALFMTSVTLGVVGYIVPIAVLTFGYALFQTSNNTAVMARMGAEDRGAMSGLLNLSRNLGLVTGASVMGAVFAAAAGFQEGAIAAPEAAAQGLKVTFGVAGLLISFAMGLEIARGNRVSPAL
jgi:EmrB/QacA subfamily drug resistance transporter